MYDLSVYLLDFNTIYVKKEVLNLNTVRISDDDDDIDHELLCLMGSSCSMLLVVDRRIR